MVDDHESLVPTSVGYLTQLGARCTEVQFHPESVMTQGGHRLLASWSALTGEDAR